MSHAAIDTVEKALVWADHPGDCEQCDRDAVKVLADGVRRLREQKGQWWCCKADFGKHEETCPNYRSFTPAMVREWIRDELAKHDIPNESDPYPEIIMAVVHRLDEQEAKG